MRDFDINNLVSFIALVKAGSFIEASRQQGIPSNTLSRHLTALETAAGVKLVQRSTRKFVVTRAGRDLFDKCESSTSEIFDAVREAKSFTSVARGTVRVAAPVDFFEIFEPGWLLAFFNAHPEINVEFSFGNTNIDLLSTRLDVVFCRGPLISARPTAKRFVSIKDFLVASPTYLESNPLATTPYEVSENRCVTIGGTTNNWLIRSAGAPEPAAIKVRGRISVDNTHAALRAVMAGHGIGLLPENAVASGIATGALVRVLPDYWREGDSMFAVFPSRDLSAATSTFIRFSAEHLNSQAVTGGQFF